MRLTVVSNRLPVTVTQSKGSFRVKASVGGLVSGLNPFLESLNAEGTERLWVGWPGVSPKKEGERALRRRLADEFGARPVFLKKSTVKDFYGGFCNRTLWPLFHYFTTFAEYRERYWRAYRRVNEAFAQVILEEAKPADTIWVHDYHLMLLPELLRAELPDAAIGYFHHIPFPSFEVYRLLPRAWGRAILEGVTGADLVGFHTYDYTGYFLRSLLRVLGLENDRGEVNRDGRLVRVDTIPMGVDFPRFAGAQGEPKVRGERGRHGKTLEGQRVVLSIDRLDYTKGIVNRLEGFEEFLVRQPEWRGRVTLFLVVVPSRTRVLEYRRMKRQIDQLVGRINGRFGGVAWTPILYQYTQLGFPTLAALYGLADVALVTPLRDGMNLIAMEYVASRQDGAGVLILSEMAGAARELPEALIVNPSDRGDIAEALARALAMPTEEQASRNEAMIRRLRRRDALWWGRTFLESLQEVKDTQAELRDKLLAPAPRARLVEAFHRAPSRLLLLNYDGSLVPFVRYPQRREPDEGLDRLLRRLARGEGTEVVVVSGRPRKVLDGWFADAPLGLIAEHGAWVRRARGAWETVGSLREDWKEDVLPLLESCADRVPRSAVEVKEYSLVWHYGSADPELGSSRAAELVDEVTEAVAGENLVVLRGGKVVEVRNAGVTKGTAARYWLAEGQPDFVCGVGDDWTDESLFRALPSEAWSLRVGMAHTQARWIVTTPEDVRALLGALSEGSP